MRWGVRSLRALLRPEGRRAAEPKTAVWDDAGRTFRNIWRHLVHATDRKYPLKRRRPNAIVLQMGKVGSTSIRAGLCARGINAFHSHRLSPAMQQRALRHVLESDLTVRVVSRDLRKHIQNVALHALARWYEQHKRYEGHKLRVVTLTRDPVTRYPSGFVYRWSAMRSRIAAWHRFRSGAPADAPLQEAAMLQDLIAEVTAIVAECRPSDGQAGLERCFVLAQERWPSHPVIRSELGHMLAPLTWFDREIGDLFGLDMLAAAELRERGWAERSNDWVDIQVLRFEDLASLVPQLARFVGLAELTLPRKNVTAVKPGAADVANAWKAVLATPTGQACARELRTSAYGRACGYERLA
jgi:hypothetical protein